MNPTSLDKTYWNWAIGLAAIVLAVGVSSYAIAEWKLTSHHAPLSDQKKQLVELYIRDEFANGNDKLRKFDLLGAIPMAIDCGSLEQAKCQLAKDTLSQSFEPSVNAELIMSGAPVITFVFENSAQVKAMLPKADEDFLGGISDVSDPECVLFYQHADSRTQRAEILASVEQPTNKLKACLITQIGRLLGPGFSRTDDFALIWAAALSKYSDGELDQHRHMYSILEYIHMCRELTAGMSESDVRKVLLLPSRCMSNLELSN